MQEAELQVFLFCQYYGKSWVLMKSSVLYTWLHSIDYQTTALQK